MKIGILSDSHGNVAAVQQAIRIFESMQVSLIIHCGDIGSNVVSAFAGFPTHFVPGNIDDVEHLREVIVDPAHTLHEQLGTLEIEGCRVAFLHGDNAEALRHAVHSGHWHLVCHGHSHAFGHHFEGRTLVLNPGALVRTRKPSLAVVDLPSLEVTEIPL
jgi:putative phosphoesterase